MQKKQKQTDKPKQNPKPKVDREADKGHVDRRPKQQAKAKVDKPVKSPEEIEKDKMEELTETQVKCFAMYQAVRDIKLSDSDEFSDDDTIEIAKSLQSDPKRIVLHQSFSEQRTLNNWVKRLTAICKKSNIDLKADTNEMKAAYLKWLKEKKCTHFALGNSKAQRPKPKDEAKVQTI